MRFSIGETRRHSAAAGKVFRWALLAAGAIGSVIPTLSQQPSLRGSRYRHDSQVVAQALKQQNARAYRDALAILCDHFPNNSRALLKFAAAEARMENIAGASALLSRYAQMGLVIDRSNSVAVALQDIAGKITRLRKNTEPMSHAQVAFLLPDKDLLVEDVAFDPDTKRFFLSSVRERKILNCDERGTCRDFARSSIAVPLGAVLAIHVDASRRVLWATTAGLKEAAGLQPGEHGKSSALKFDLRSAKLLKRYSPNDGKEHAMGDMTISSNGDAYISDGLSGDVFVISHDRDGLVPLVPPGTFVSPQTPALSSDEKTLYVPDYAAGIAVIRLADRHVDWLASTLPAAFEGIDGMYLINGRLVAVQNGTMPERIVSFHMNPANQVDSFQVLEANWPELGDPTHGVFVQDKFYFITNSGWDRVGKDGRLAPGEASAVRKIDIDWR